MEHAQENKRYYWQPLSLHYLLDNFKITGRRVLIPLIGWIVLICACIFISSVFEPVGWLVPEAGDPQVATFFVIYPIYVIGLLLLFWLGFEWGFIPLFISSFALAFQSGIGLALSMIFSFSFIFGLALFGLAYQSLRIPIDLRGLKSISFFISISFIASLGSSICALIWSLSHHLTADDTTIIWTSWWTAVFFQSIIITGPVLFLFTPMIERLKQKHYGSTEEAHISLKWIYGTVFSVTAVLVMFIFSGQFLGKFRLSEVLNRMPDIARGDVIGALDSFEIIFWLSIGIIVLTGYTAIYLVGQWNGQLQDEVDERTLQLEQSKQMLQKSLHEKQLFLQETHHRVKNSLAQVSGLLQLQMMEVNDEKYSQLIKDATNRIHSMSLIHQALYDTEEYSNISLEEYLQKLCTIIHRSFNDKENGIAMNFKLSKCSAGSQQATTLGLITTEILINAYKHAFKDRERGTIAISLEQQGEKLLLCIEDDGIGLPPNSSSRKKSLGMKLIHQLSQQINADLSIKSDDRGTAFSLLFEPVHKNSIS